ncbi:putative E3 ubiquitin-protein ligase ARI6 [Gymnodraco acuticeps]|uniref:E3 ubiquitin-protein ligase ARI6 n=1 Tax=Gymnodraco acuticeps TaxID=8218 RepID=A0A6P8TBF2_GYMAC|nr:putative E3 ubiquitin-protein ligase ARI6 [Gymnodraco acuticeps]
MTTPGQEEKRYDPRDTTLKFVNKPDALDAYPPEDGDQCLCAEMSCGHAVTPQSLTGWCRSLLDQGQYKFKCPALKDGTVKKCDKEWSYQEVRRLAVLTASEMAYFEERMARLAATEYCEFKTCPGCKTYVEREAQSNLSVMCTICTDEKKKVYNFCWQCLKEWKGAAPRSDRCDNDGCINAVLELLKNCKTTALSEVQGVTACPSIRACPTCGTKVEHDTTGCKNIICPRCQVEFCFVCLKLTPECLQTSSYFLPCSAGVAPKQTSIPVWHRN